MATDAQKRARNKWNAANKASIRLQANKTYIEEIKEHCKKRDESLNGFLIRSTKNQIYKDKESSDDNS